MSKLLFDRAGRSRSPATMPGFHAGRPPRNKGLRYPADPPKAEEIVAVMRAAGSPIGPCRPRGVVRPCRVARAKRRGVIEVGLGEAERFLGPQRRAKGSRSGPRSRRPCAQNNGPTGSSTRNSSH
jgi:hypothetical protein